MFPKKLFMCLFGESDTVGMYAKFREQNRKGETTGKSQTWMEANYYIESQTRNLGVDWIDLVGDKIQYQAPITQ